MTTEFASIVMALSARTAAVERYKNLQTVTRFVTNVPDRVPRREAIALRWRVQALNDRMLRVDPTKDANCRFTISQVVNAILKAPPDGKLVLFNYLPVIPIPVVAAFLSVPEQHLYALHHEGHLGDRYLKRRCFSFRDVQLIVSNPNWVQPDKIAPLQSDSPTPEVFYPFVTVSLFVAIAYTGLSLPQLKRAVQPNGNDHRGMPTYRMSDLEKVRLKELKEAQG